MPEGFAASAKSAIKFVYGLTADHEDLTIELVRTDANRRTFDATVHDRIQQLAAQHNDTLKCPMLIEHAQEGSELRHRVRAYADTLTPDFFATEIFVLVGTSIYRIYADSEITESIRREEDRLREVAAHALPFVEGARGFCLGEACFNGRHDQETGEVLFRDPARPRSRVALRINAVGASPEESLLQRWDRNSGALARIFTSPFSTKRRGRMRLAGMDAEELLLHGRYQGNLVLEFEAESRRTIGSFAMPYIDLTLAQQGGQTGSDPGGPYWTLDEGVAVWDKILASLALRPGSV